MAFKRYGARTDSNQSSLVRQINSIPGCKVIDLSGVAGGCPDILIQHYTVGVYKFYLVEIKTAKGRLNKKQKVFHVEHHCHVAKTLDDILHILGL